MARWTARLDSHTGFAIAKGNEGSYSSPGAAAYQFTFTLCSTGQFYIINSGSYFGSSCHSCPAGKYQATSTSCAVCASGKYQTAAAQSSCTACAKGRYQSDNAVNAANHDAASDCIVCAAGKYVREHTLQNGRCASEASISNLLALALFPSLQSERL